MENEFKIEAMDETNVYGASQVEFKCFTDPLSTTLLKKELENPLAHYIVVKSSCDNVIAYAGFWTISGDAQIMNVAVDPDFRRRHIGDMLIEKMIEMAESENLQTMSLEVRVSNEAAISLYKKYKFEIQGRRKNYYQDNNEDAYIMWKYLV